MDEARASYGQDLLLVCARLFLVTLFVISGWDKLSHFSATVGAMAQRGLPFPALAAAMAVAAELPLCLLLAVGVWTRPLALVLAVYTLATAFIGHRFWELEGAARVGNMFNFYKNFGLAGGFMLLSVTGPGRYAVAAMQRARRYESALS